MAATERKRRAEWIIHGASAAAGVTAATAWFPGSDAVAIMPIQVAMVAAIGREYGLELSEGAVKAVVYATLAQVFGRAGAGLLVRYVPVAGNLMRASVAVSITEGLGRFVLERLEAGEALV